MRSICDRGVVLSHGRMVAEGDPGEATRIFRERLMAEGAGMSIIDPALVAVPATPDMVGNEGIGVSSAPAIPGGPCGSARSTASTRVTTTSPT